MKSIDNKESIIITATDLKQNLGKYLDFVEQQNEVVITKNGKKICRLTPYITDIEQYFLVRERALDYQYGGKKVSYEEFMEIYEKSDLRMEFINGEIYLLSSPNIGHQRILGRLYVAFNEYFEDKVCEVFLAPFDVHFSKKILKSLMLCNLIYLWPVIWKVILMKRASIWGPRLWLLKYYQITHEAKIW